MTIDTSPDIEIAVEPALDALEDRDAVAAASTFATNGQVVDPQSPEREYRAQELGRAALEWALTNPVTERALTNRRCLEHEETCVLAVESRSDRSDGSPRKTTTASVVEIGDEGITNWGTYPLPSRTAGTDNERRYT